MYHAVCIIVHAELLGHSGAYTAWFGYILQALRTSSNYAPPGTTHLQQLRPSRHYTPPATTPLQALHISRHYVYASPSTTPLQALRTSTHYRRYAPPGNTHLQAIHTSKHYASPGTACITTHRHCSTVTSYLLPVAPGVHH